MPGDNIVVIPTRYPISEGTQLLANSKEPIITLEDEGTAVYHYPTQLASGERESFAIELLRHWPGVELNKRKNALYIPLKTVCLTAVNGAYVFGHKPPAAE